MVSDKSNVPLIQFSSHSTKRLIYSLVLLTIIVLTSVSISWFGLRFYGVGAGRVIPQQLVVIDTDPGIDDAVAILTTLGDVSVKVLGITCVRGNTNVTNVALNTLKLLQVANLKEIPVYSGHNYGLIESPSIDDWFGEDGLGDVPFPNPPSLLSVQDEHAAVFLAWIVKQYPGQITIFGLGPLTNMALALHLNPEFLNQVRRVIILGGSIKGQGNAAPGVEYNFHMDPDAASLVLSRATTSSPITLVPMETCQENDLSQSWRWKSLSNINNSVMSFLNTLEMKQLQMHPSSSYNPFDVYVTAVYLAENFVLHSKEMYGFVENTGLRSRGSLVIDYLNLTNHMANLEVIMEVNISAIQNMMFDNLSNFK